MLPRDSPGMGLLLLHLIVEEHPVLAELEEDLIPSRAPEELLKTQALEMKEPMTGQVSMSTEL